MDKCVLCNNTNINELPKMPDIEVYKCPNCGNVNITEEAIIDLPKYNSDIWLLSAFCWIRTSRDLPAEQIHTGNLDDIIKRMKSEKSNRALDAQNRIIKYLGDRSNLLGSWIHVGENFHQELIMKLEELEYLFESMQEHGLLEEDDRTTSARTSFNDVRLSFEGWEKYEYLKISNFDSNMVFIAMWYDNKTQKLRECLKSAVDNAGYDPIIVDERLYIGNIMNYVLGRIKESKFIIADFTVNPENPTNIPKNDDEKEVSRIQGGTRGGVYYEAGFAKGLGLKVIHTCKDDNISRSRLHFDIEQEKTIFWKDEYVKTFDIRSEKERRENPTPKNLSEELYDLIIYILGKGKNKH